MAAGRLLVVAPDNDLSRSLLFALEAEGYDVTVRSELPDHAWVSQQRFDATILDQKALTGADYASIAFCVKAYPVVLLAAHPHPWLVQWVTDVVEPPLLGNALSVSVHKALHLER